MAGTIDAVLYDFGGVFTMSPFTAVRRESELLGLDPDIAAHVLFGPYEEDTDHPWHRLERGEVTLAACRAEVLELAVLQGITSDPFLFLIGMAGEDTQRDEVVERARRVRRTGLPSALVTNNVAEFGNGWRSLIPVDELFDIIIDSSATGVRKPNPAMYRAALEALGVEPARAVFLDDFAANVAAAEAIGIRGILVGDDRVAAFDELDRILGSGAGGL